MDNLWIAALIWIGCSLGVAILCRCVAEMFTEVWRAVRGWQ